MVYIYILKNNNYKQQKFVKMKKILALITIVTLVSCGNQNSTEVKTEDTIMVADSTITLDSTSMVVDSAITESK
jgi:lipoprotein NlpI